MLFNGAQRRGNSFVCTERLPLNSAMIASAKPSARKGEVREGSPGSIPRRSILGRCRPGFLIAYEAGAGRYEDSAASVGDRFLDGFGESRCPVTGHDRTEKTWTLAKSCTRTTVCSY